MEFEVTGFAVELEMGQKEASKIATTTPSELWKARRPIAEIELWKGRNPEPDRLSIADNDERRGDFAEREPFLLHLEQQ